MAGGDKNTEKNKARSCATAGFVKNDQAAEIIFSQRAL